MDPKAFTNYILIGISESDSFLELNSKGDADDDVGRDIYVVTDLLEPSKESLLVQEIVLGVGVAED